MSGPAITAGRDETLSQAARLMRNFEAKRLPVVAFVVEDTLRLTRWVDGVVEVVNEPRPAIPPFEPPAEPLPFTTAAR